MSRGSMKERQRWILVVSSFLVSLVSPGLVHAQRADIPRPLVEMMEQLSRLETAEFSYKFYVTFDDAREQRPLGTERSLIEYGNVQLDFSNRAYRWERWNRSSPDEPFRNHRTSVLAEGTHFMTIQRDLIDPKNDVASIGGNTKFFSPFNMLGLGYSVSNDKPHNDNADQNAHLAEQLIEEQHMGIEPTSQDGVFTIKSINETERFPDVSSRTDLIIHLDPTKGNLPKHLEFRVRSFDDPSIDYQTHDYTILEYEPEERWYFPTVIERRAGRPDAQGSSTSRWVIDRETLKINDANQTLDLELDTAGMRVQDARFKPKRNPPLKLRGKLGF